MKRRLRIVVITTALCTGITYSCSEEFLDRPPIGTIPEPTLANQAGVDGSLIQAYRTLRGANVAAWYTSPWNWVWGSMRSDEAYKGSEASDQNVLNPVEKYEDITNLGELLNKWSACYDGIGMANTTLRLLADAGAEIDAADALQIEAEARFIRGFHHFEAKRNFNKVPYVGEDVESIADFQAVKNDTDIYPQIDADLQFAYDNLTPTKSQKGRVNKWAAGAFLAKSKLYQKKYAEAKALFDVIKAQGVTSQGAPYALLPKFSDVFRGANDNGPEVIFAVQSSVADGVAGENGTLETELTNPHNDGPGGCCGFFQPSQTLVNNFKTVAGLPDPSPNTLDVISHESAPTTAPDRGTFDPRLERTVGRVGITYMDWGLAKSSWIRNLPNGGPWLPHKSVHTSAERGGFQTAGPWGQSRTAKNILVMRYADLLLMSAEADIETNNLASALASINLVRNRAANPADFLRDANGVLEANYVIAPYVAFASQAEARTAVRRERLLELAMEGHRRFDLVRWGIDTTVIPEYLAREQVKRTHLGGATYEASDAYLPIPQYVINQSKGNITK